MTTFLLLTVYAPLSSWGEVAVGELRPTWDRPSRSALLGMVAAALGITREEQDAHDALDLGYGVAVRCDSHGTPMTDYHTVQSVPSADIAKAWGAGPRRTVGELFDATRKRATLVTRRSLIQEACFTIALWARPGARWSLSTLASALREPAFVLYAGRKANALGLPLHPVCVEATSLAAALDLRPLLPPGLGDVPPDLADVLRIGPREVSSDNCAADGVEDGLLPLRREKCRDTHAHRTRWQFAVRTVDVGLWTPPVDATSPLAAPMS